MKLTKKAFIRIVSFAVATVTAVAALAIVTHNRINDYQTQIGYTYSMHLDELDSSLYNISIALQKSLYASSATQLSSLAVELCTESTVAKNSLAQLPYSGESLNNLNRFLSQVGDYTLYLSKKVIQGDGIVDEERENLHLLSQTAQSVSSSVSVVRSEYDRDGVWNTEKAETIAGSIGEDFESSLTGLEELLADYPSLVYDGPFSDHMLQGELKMLSNAQAMTSDEALQNAAKNLGIDVSGFTEEAETAGNVPCYNFTDGSMSFSVTKQGGYIIYMRKYRPTGEQTITYEEAVTRAKEYLDSVKGTNFIATYYFADEGVCTVNFAHKEGATVCYPDLIKVGVALDTGEIVLVEAGGYLANHYTRTIPTPKYTASQAQERLSKSLKIHEVRRCIIPTDGNAEKHCYEFRCEGVDGEELLIYVNVQNLEEEKILLLLKTDGGTLTK